jgi:hypothetical protein
MTAVVLATLPSPLVTDELAPALWRGLAGDWLACSPAELQNTDVYPCRIRQPSNWPERNGTPVPCQNPALAV